MAGEIWVVVIRKLPPTAGVDLDIGDIVDASSWPKREALIRQRWIRPATAQEVAAAEEEEVDVAPPPPLKAKAAPRSKKR